MAVAVTPNPSEPRAPKKPDQPLGLYAARAVGARAMVRLMAESGLDDMPDVISEIEGRSEGAMRALIRSLPDGTYTAEGLADLHPDPPIKLAVHVTIAGDGPALPPLRELAAALGLGERVTFAGTVTGSALRDLYARSHLAVSSLGLHRIGLASASVV